MSRYETAYLWESPVHLRAREQEHLLRLAKTPEYWYWKGVLDTCNWSSIPDDYDEPDYEVTP